MTSEQRDTIAAAMRDHAHAKAKLEAELTSLAASCVPAKALPVRREDHQTLYMQAQILRHRIAIALLSSRLPGGQGGD